MFQSTNVGKDHGEIENEKKNINLICSFKQLWKFLKVNLSAEYIYEKKKKWSNYHIHTTSFFKPSTRNMSY